MKNCLLLLFIFNLLLLNAQLQTSSGHNPYNLVQYDLMGFGVEVSNVTYSGSLEAIGKFNGSVTTLGIDEGIIMTTGTVANVEAGPHGPNDLTNAGVDNAMPGYPPLSNLFEISTFNASVLEFDFVSISDTVQLEYVFGSEEYPEYINTQFNDVIAFFISGPGINGVRNMALIPNTSLEVNINSINNGQSNSGPCNYCIYYNFNGNGDTQPHNNESQYIQYDGFTTPLKAFSVVEPGETYHLIIAIADGGDGNYDSGLFLKTKSLTSSLINYEKTNKIKLYPNPNQGSFTIENITEEKMNNIEIFGVDGKEVAFDLEKLDQSTSKIHFKQPAQGVYWVKIISKDGSFYSEKFVVE